MTNHLPGSASELAGVTEAEEEGRPGREFSTTAVN